MFATMKHISSMFTTTYKKTISSSLSITLITYHIAYHRLCFWYKTELLKRCKNLPCVQKIQKHLRYIFVNLGPISSDSDYLKVITESGSKKYCDTVIPPKFSNASNVKLEFFSDFSGTFRGFQLDYYISDFACGRTIAGNRPGLIASPGYPGHYPQDAECNWLIETGAPMALTFRRVELDARYGKGV